MATVQWSPVEQFWCREFMNLKNNNKKIFYIG